MEKLLDARWALMFVVIHSFSSVAQELKWNSSPQTGFVFQITNREAQKLLAISSPDTIFKGLLYKQVDTFNVKTGWINRPHKGHFILAKIVENKLHCEYTGVFPYQVFLTKEYDALALQVLDLDGNVREDAIVKFKLKRLRVDPESKTYRIENDPFFGETKIVTVELDGFRSLFNIEKHEVPSWYNNSETDDGPTYYSYMITDKNKYRPNDKVRFKSYALSHSRSPLRKNLGVWLSYRGKSTKLASVEPHRPGSYASEFILHDSLKLTLDRNYNLQLRERNGRIVSSCNFSFEDYELNGNRLEIQLTTDKQFHPAKNELSIIATDVNGLLLKDARARVVVRTQSIRETFQSVVILPDTLFYSEINLDSDDATKVDIPSRLFQKTNTYYEVNVSVLNSENQLIDQTVGATHYYSQYELTTRFSNDSIVYEMLQNGISIKKTPISLRHDDEVKALDVYLPYKEKINPLISTIHLSGPLASRQIPMNNLLPNLEMIGGIEQDSFNITLNNPQKIDVSWYIYQGSVLLQKGFGNELVFHSVITDRTQTYYVEVLYSFGGVERIKRKEYEFRDDYLTVSLDVPERAFPGQQVDATIKVVDQLGRPVNGVDLTALAVNGKLDYFLPDLPYYGNGSTPRSKKAHYSKSDINKRHAVLDLDYKKWEKQARLDTMKYYQFAYPSKIFSYAYAVEDSTQFAPYVVQNGTAKQVYVIELNRIPVYYSWVDRPKDYSFYVPAERKVEVTLRLYDRVLQFDSLSFSSGKKTILSVDLGHLPESVKVIKIDPPKLAKNKRAKTYHSFTPTEVKRHNTYLSSFSYVNGTSYLSGRVFVPLFNTQSRSYNSAITVGPITPGKQTFIGPNSVTTYQHEGGYMYGFDDNVVYKLNAPKLIPDRLENRSFSPILTLNDLAMTKRVFLESAALSNNGWHTRIVNLVDHSTHIKVLLPEEKEASGLASILFENCQNKAIISPCQSQYSANSGFNTIPRGYHNVIALYLNGTYLRIDSINLRAYTKVVIDLNQNKLLPTDSLSRRLLKVLSNTCHGSTEPRVISMRFSRRTEGNIKGKVFDENNMPLPGANIVVKGTTNGAIADEEGHFTIDSDEPIATLVVSFVGYGTSEIEVQVGSDVSVYMTPDIMQLSEIVVVAYGANLGRESLSYALSGKVAGVQVSTPDTEIPNTEDREMQEAENKLYDELLKLSTIRSRFADVAFWEPKLFTDRLGQSTFKISFPDDITRWEATVFAMNRHLQSGTTRNTIKSYKPIMAGLHVPQFLTQGDSAVFIGNISNYSQDKNIIGSVKWHGTQSGFEKKINFSEFHIDKLPVNVVTTDSVTASYLFTRDDGYLDGEERTIPVLEQGIVRADGTLSTLKNRDNMTVKASSNEALTVEILSNQIDVYAGEARYLLNYKYDCNEQLASKLLGLINYRLLVEKEGKPFKYEKDVNKIITRLLKNQNDEFLWSWWDVSMNTSYWMSSHILRALKCAKDAGYKVDLNIENITRKAEYKFDFLHQYSLSDIDLLQAMAVWGAKLKYDKHVGKLDTLVIQKEKVVQSKHLRSYSSSLLKEKFILQEIRQLANLPYQRDTLLRYQKNGILGDIYFSDGKSSQYWYDDELATNVIAYRIIKRDSLLLRLVLPMQLYFLSQRNKNQWNTYHSSSVLTNVLPDLLAESVSNNQEATVNLSGDVSATINKFPYRLELQPRDEIKITNESGLPIYLVQYKKERVTKAKTGIEGFEIRTMLGNNQETLEAGRPVPFTVEVNVKKEAKQEYVMIEVPIPASCSYADKTQSSNTVETHREYFKDRTVIFCENMKSGKYTFVIQLIPRFTGKYLINPAQVSLMYVPVVNANTDMKNVRVD